MNAPSRVTGISALMRPRSIVVLGASASRQAKGNAAIRNLEAQGYGGDLYVVHRTAETVDTIPALPSISALPVGIDVALVSLPARSVGAALEQLAERGCRSAVVPSVGMTDAELGRIAELAEQTGMAIHGPNCMGVINVSDRIPLWFYEGMLTEERPGDIALVSQSGSASMFVVRSTEGVGYSKIISTGSEAALTTADYLEFLADDPATRTVACVLESIPDIAAFEAAVGHLRSADKPLYVLKVGRTAAGASASVAHTGALIGRDDAYRRYFRALDVPMLRDYDELASVLQCATVPGLPQPAGGGVGVVTISGGQAALAGDLATEAGVDLPELQPATTAALMAVQPEATAANPYDAGVSLAAPEVGYEPVLRAMLEDPGLDSVAVVLDAQASLNDREVQFTMAYFDAVARVARSRPRKPLVVASSSSTAIHPAYTNVLGPEVPVIRGISNAFAALLALAGNSRVIEDAQDQDPFVAGTDLERLRKVVGDEEGTLSAETTTELLDAYGIPVVPSLVTTSDETAVEWAATTGYPLVVKVAAPGLAHKSDIGGVVMGIDDEPELRRAFHQVIAAGRSAGADPTELRVEVQRQVVGWTEAMLGFVSDPVFGAVVTVGSGGTLVELTNDIEAAPVVVTESVAREMIGTTRLGHLLRGFRRLGPETDLEPLADLVCRLSRLAWDFRDLLSEGDLNPVLVEPGTGRCLAVDALLISTRGGDAPPAGSPRSLPTARTDQGRHQP